MSEQYETVASIIADRNNLREELAQRDAEVVRLSGLLASQRLIIAMLGTCGMNIGNEREQLRNKIAVLESQKVASVSGECEAF